MASKVLATIIQLKNQFTKPAQEIAKSTKDMAREIQKTKNGVADLGKKMMAIGAGIQAGLLADVTSVANKAKDISLGAQKIGLTTDAYQKLGYAASKSGLDMAQFETSVAKLNKTMVSAALGNKVSVQTFKYLGVTVKDTHGKLKSNTQILTEIADKFKKMSDGPKKTALAMMMFGKAGKDMIPLLNKGGKGIDDLGKKFEDLGFVIDKDSLDKLKKYRTAIADAKETMQGLKVQIALALLPSILKMKEKVEAITTNTGKWVRENKKLFDAIVVGVGVISGITVAIGAFTWASTLAITAVGNLKTVIGGLKLAYIFLKNAIIANTIVTTIAEAVQWGYLIAMESGSIGAGILAGAQWALNAAMLANPIGLIIIGIAALVAGFILAYKKSEVFRKIIQRIGKELKDWGIFFIDLWKRINANPFGKLAIDILSLYNPITTLIRHFDKIKRIGKDLKEWGMFFIDLWKRINANPFGKLVIDILALRNPLTAIIRHFDTIKGVISFIGTKIKEFATVIASLWGNINANPFGKLVIDILALRNPLTAIIRHFDKIIDGYKWIKEKLGVGKEVVISPGTAVNMKKYAVGGIATRPSIFGEAGPEMAIPLNNSARSKGLLKQADGIVNRGSVSKINNETNQVINNNNSKKEEKKEINLIFNGDIYGFDDFKEKVAKAAFEILAIDGKNMAVAG